MALNADKIPLIDLGPGLTDCLARPRLGPGKLLDTLTIATTPLHGLQTGEGRSYLDLRNGDSVCLYFPWLSYINFLSETTVWQFGHPFGKYWHFPKITLFMLHQQQRQPIVDWAHWRHFTSPAESPVVIHFSHQPSNMIYRMMENMLRWRAGHGATTAERKQFLVCWSRNLQTQWPRRQRPRRCKGWAQETKVKVLQQRRGEEWPLLGHPVTAAGQVTPGH